MRVRVYRRAFPPALFRAEFEDRHVQVRDSGIGISSGADVSDYLAGLHLLSLAQPLTVGIQVTIVVAKLLPCIEEINGVATGFAEEQFSNRSVHDRADWSPTLPQNIDRLMFSFAARFLERITKVLKGQPGNRRVDFLFSLQYGWKKYPMEKARIVRSLVGKIYSSRIAGVPTRTIWERSVASQFVRRMQP